MYTIRKAIICLLLCYYESALAVNTTNVDTSSVSPEPHKRTDIQELFDLYHQKDSTKLLNVNSSTASGENKENDTQSAKGTTPGVLPLEGGDVVTFGNKGLKVTNVDHFTTPFSTIKEVKNEQLNVSTSNNASTDTAHVSSSTVPEKSELTKKSGKIVPRKGVSPQDTGKIVARKGVQPPTSEELLENIEASTEEKTDYIENKTSCACCPNETLNDKVKNESTNSCKICCDQAGDKSVPEPSGVTHSSINSLPPAANTSVINNLSKNNSYTTESNLSTNATSTSHSVVRNKKPLVTLDVPYPSINLSSHQQMPSISNTQSRTDYVVPIVGIILAVPLVIILVIVIYKKGSEFWERRHYRRMDFLIDGMYNE